MRMIRRKTSFLVSAIVILTLLWYYYDNHRAIKSLRLESTNPSWRHPISQLVATNQAHLEVLLSKQSRTLPDARNEYLRRYRREPPQGYDAWFELAQKHDFVLIDEFDTLMHGLEPFFGLSTDVLNSRIQSTIEAKSHRLGIIKIEKHDARIPQGWEAFFDSLMPNREWLNIVPYNMTLLINESDEPMVSAAFEEITESLRKSRSSDLITSGARLGAMSSNVSFVELRKQNSLPHTYQACSPESPARQAFCLPKDTVHSFGFVASPSADGDVCQDCELWSTHGLLLNPSNLDLAQSLVPIWSTARPSHFNDLIFPPAYYTSLYFPELMMAYNESWDPTWIDKEAKFYWTGTSTGGWATVDNWSRLHRQRLVLKTHNDDEIIQLLDDKSGIPRTSTMSEIADLFATRITKVLQCTDEACAVQKAAFGVGDRPLYDAPEMAYQYRFLLDLDGNGFSGRFYRLLKSNSVVVKQTVLREWHDDRVIPWVHYVPLSTSYDELPELARFLATTKEGSDISERIARESKEWCGKALRDVDLQLVWLRILLEFGRLMNRDA